MKRMVLCATLVVMSCGFALGQTEKVLYSFGPAGECGDGADTTLVSDSLGNLFGTTFYGGIYGGGNIFELSPNADGTWSETSLYSFCYPPQGACLAGAGANPLTVDASGNLYGTTSGGGLGNDGTGGVAFELSPPAAPSGIWTYVVIYNFCSVGGSECLDGASPTTPLTIGKSGNLYGTAGAGGRNGGGVVFELSPASNGWTQTVLYNFCSNLQSGYCLDGTGPLSGLTLDKSGNLYGTTYSGGSTGAKAAGALYELSPGSDGWVETVLATFSARASSRLGHTALAGPVSMDLHGNLYTTQVLGGIYGHKGISYGGVDRLTTKGVPGMFAFNGTDGDGPYGVLIDNERGLLYGSSSAGGAYGNYFDGNVYQIDKSGQETVLYNFCSLPACSDGVYPQAGLLEDAQGNLYGVTFEGGAYGLGVVFEITP